MAGKMRGWSSGRAGKTIENLSGSVRGTIDTPVEKKRQEKSERNRVPHFIFSPVLGFRTGLLVQELWIVFERFLGVVFFEAGKSLTD